MRKIILFVLLLNCMQAPSLEEVLLQKASKGSNLAVTKEMDVNHQNKEGYTALMFAASNGSANTVKFLLARGADVNLKNKYGMTALMRACRNGHRKVVQSLVVNGANVNIRDKDGMTALAHANQRKKFKIAKYIKDVGGVL